jgi:hypothetical protein
LVGGSSVELAEPPPSQDAEERGIRVRELRSICAARL